MGSRLKLHEELCELLGSRNCYFQPPESVKLKYPCIVYFKDTTDIQYADNRTYTIVNHYDVTVITKDPDSETPDKLLEHFEMIRSDRNYTADNLHHFVMELFY